MKPPIPQGSLQDCPLEWKKLLAWTIVSSYHGEMEADRACEAWKRRVAGEDPMDIPEAKIDIADLDESWMVDAARLLFMLGLETSTSRARAVIKQGGVRVGPDRRKIADPTDMIGVQDGLVVRVGKRRIVRVALEGSGPYTISA